MCEVEGRGCYAAFLCWLWINEGALALVIYCFWRKLLLFMFVAENGWMCPERCRFDLLHTCVVATCRHACCVRVGQGRVDGVGLIFWSVLMHELIQDSSVNLSNNTNVLTNHVILRIVVHIHKGITGEVAYHTPFERENLLWPAVNTRRDSMTWWRTIF